MDRAWIVRARGVPLALSRGCLLNGCNRRLNAGVCNSGGQITHGFEIHISRIIDQRSERRRPREDIDCEGRGAS